MTTFAIWWMWFSCTMTALALVVGMRERTADDVERLSPYCRAIQLLCIAANLVVLHVLGGL